MGFEVWASGSRGSGKKLFHYSKKNCLDQGDFEPPKLLTMLPSSPNAAGVAEKIVGSPESHIGGATVAGMFKIAEMEMAHLLASSVDMLAISGRNGKINLYCLESKWYWADSNSFISFSLNSSDPGRDFIRKISPGLVKTDLNNFGVLGQLAIVLTKYNSELPNSADPFINIELSH